MSGAPQFGVPYTLVGPDGTRVVFNDDTDPDCVGVISEATGFDSAEVRESAEDLVEFDGGIHGNFYYGRRPITIEGLVYGHETAAERNEKLIKIQRASNAMRGNATLTWTTDGGEPVFLELRRQQPLRVSGNWNKTFQLAMVASDPRIYSTTIYSGEVEADEQLGGAEGAGFDQGFDIDFGEAAPVGQLIIAQAGSTETFPVITVVGPGTGPQWLNFTTGASVKINYTLTATDVLVIDTLNRSVQVGTLSGIDDWTPDPETLISRYSALDFDNTVWGGILPGTNDLRLGFFSAGAGAKMRVDWRNAWL